MTGVKTKGLGLSGHVETPALQFPFPSVQKPLLSVDGRRAVWLPALSLSCPFFPATTRDWMEGRVNYLEGYRKPEEAEPLNKKKQVVMKKGTEATKVRFKRHA